MAALNTRKESCNCDSFSDGNFRGTRVALRLVNVYPSIEYTSGEERRDEEVTTYEEIGVLFY